MYYNENSVLYFNGEYVKAAEAKTDLYSQSLHYGYAVFEGIKSYSTAQGTRIFKAKEHYERLKRSAELMLMPFEYTADEMVEITYELLEKNGLSNAYIRPIVVCSPNMSLSKGKESYLAIEVWNWDNGYLANQMNVMTSSFERPNPKAFKVEAKVSGHYVNSILACQEAKDKGFDEAVVLDHQGFVAESSGANVFYEKDGVLYTPPKGSILPGITRATVFEICDALGIPYTEKLFTPEEMRGSDAAFFCGTAAEIVALGSMDSVPFSLPWEDTLSSVVQKAYRHLVVEEDYTYLKSQLKLKYA
ncbi:MULTISPECIES: branched-chain-amino-acid transaminase [Chryseobacterium]|uniref:Branched-chain-amino-acid aminotransferase n=1 Tax=Chryseobacterium camelliae TaxID=1265445 RepID=A0ABU0TF55_9FLAO|nr:MULTISPECIES: branched-chain-amino-acid transaminase [Chryseobacterium]MDT3406503.1 branched-chain amino acid aminotransferase [Pseudacidovorax intermedius]MDQ1095699.1 branched-chain amino acid aminotransferase [Chryseobacterium camelliae]MDQ1099635.1 branched-chain amino acid aminotransferase [Chryseobacterium sp. SORGH_AS_1048]MDR6086984.1 branched-chain amino acid aminotransferase [Chryseobacterium sp. SORGH_AS_0909]MDR6131356.1 branched-chain amino acid aminotransferase [Chryseobacteri